jgi:serine/threonine protein kinase
MTGARHGHRLRDADAASSSEDVAPAFRAGERCDKYEIVQLLAMGGSGEVYRAVQRSIGREVAIKALQFRHVARADLKARMEMEAKALGCINHPNVVTVFDAGCTDAGVVWIAMELLVGRTLREVLQDRVRLPVDEAVACAIDVAEGVGAAHREKIIHRDIKPENVFITDRGMVKVLDLGTAKLQGWGGMKTTDRRRVLGTPAYMAPEHIRCIGVDVRTDVYALGLVLYEMLAGHPFAHLAHLEDYQELARLQLFAEPRPPHAVVPAIPEALSKVVLHALAKDPSQRPQSMEDLVHELRAALGLPEPVVRISARPPPLAVAPASEPTQPGSPVPSGALGPRGTIRLAQSPVAPRVVQDRPDRPGPAPGIEPTGPMRAEPPRVRPPRPSRERRSSPPKADAPRADRPRLVRGPKREMSSRWVLSATLVGSLVGAAVAVGVLIWMDRTRATPIQRISEPNDGAAPAAASSVVEAPSAEAAVASADSVAVADASSAEPRSNTPAVVPPGKRASPTAGSRASSASTRPAQAPPPPSSSFRFDLGPPRFGEDHHPPDPVPPPPARSSTLRMPASGL